MKKTDTTANQPDKATSWSESVNYAIQAGIVLLTAAAFVKSKLER